MEKSHPEFIQLISTPQLPPSPLEWLNMGNSAWLVVASLLQQGPVEGAPYCLSGRTILSVWWFFMMILIAMYTANLAAFLTVTRMKAGIKDVEKLLIVLLLKLGTVKDDGLETLLKGSEKVLEEYKKLADNLDNVDNAEKGIERVAKEEYALIYESAYLEMRFRLFKLNAHFVASENDVEGETAYFALNMFSTMTGAEKQRYQGLNAIGHSPNLPNLRSRRAVVPDQKLWMNEGKVTAVKNQGSCGSCWTFGAVGGLETRYAIKSGVLRNFAEQEYLDCVYEGQKNGCNGGWPYDCYTHSAENGRLAATSDYPYAASDGGCNVGSTPNALVAAKISGYTSVGYGETACIAALAEGSVSMEIEVTTRFQSYSSGVLQDTSCTGSINHAVTGVGYTPDYVVVKNSWGTAWGDGGFIKMTRNHHNCDLWNYVNYPDLTTTGVPDNSAGDTATSYDPLKTNSEDIAVPCENSVGESTCKTYDDQYGYCAEAWFVEDYCRKYCGECTEEEGGGDNGECASGTVRLRLCVVTMVTLCGYYGDIVCGYHVVTMVTLCLVRLWLPCYNTPKPLECLNEGGSLWLVVASLLQQGPVEGAPYCLSGRTLLDVWWFFMMILIAMYTANLAAFLTVTGRKAGIKEVEDLVYEGKLKGCNGGWGDVNYTNPEELLKLSEKVEYKYLADDGGCNVGSIPNALVAIAKISGYTSVGYGETACIAALAERAVGKILEVLGRLPNYTSGVLQVLSAALGCTGSVGQAVTGVGYTPDLVVVLNHMGKILGDGGLIKPLENYANIYEWNYLEYPVLTTCNLVIAGEKFSKFGFAFGVPPNSPHLDLFNNVILKLREKNELDNDWEKIGDTAREEDELKTLKSRNKNETAVPCVNGKQNVQESTCKLDMKNLSGLFTVIFIGVVTSFIFLIAEYSFACYEDVYGNVYGNDVSDQINRPKYVAEAFARRLKLTWQDILSHWFVEEYCRKLCGEIDCEEGGDEGDQALPPGGRESPMGSEDRLKRCKKHVIKRECAKPGNVKVEYVEVVKPLGGARVVFARDSPHLLLLLGQFGESKWELSRAITTPRDKRGVVTLKGENLRIVLVPVECSIRIPGKAH
eukprot:sb/3479321/